MNSWYACVSIQEFLFLFFCAVLFFLFSSFLKFIYFNWWLITFQHCSGFYHTLTWISHGCTCVPHPEPPHLPPHPISQDHSSSPDLSTLSHASNLDWRSVTYMLIHIFQSYFSNHPTLTFSHRVEKTVLYICVSFAVWHIGSLLASF